MTELKLGKITKIAMYNSGARVMRASVVTLSKGVNNLRFSGIAACYDADSFTAKATKGRVIALCVENDDSVFCGGESISALSCTISVYSEEEERAEISLSAFTSKAGWTPRYRIDVANMSDKIPMSVTLQACAQQQTGEEWDGNISFITGEPRFSYSMPKFKPQYVGNENDIMPRAALMRASMEPQMADSMAYGVAESGTDSAMAFTPNFTLPVKSGSKSIIELKSYNAKAEIFYKTIPFASTAVYLIAKLGSPMMFLSGDASVFVGGISREFNEGIIVEGGDFAGTTHLHGSMDEIPLCLYDGISVRRETGNKFKSTKMLGGEKTVYDFVITLCCDERAKTVKVTDRIPVSSDKSVNVELIEGSGATFNAETGRLDWEISLKENEQKTLNVNYIVVKSK